MLRAAHARGIVHRDVKPANVMVSESGRVRLGDFGVAAILDDPTVSTSGAVIGSPAYMAPEQATNKGALPESDLWSLGATLYFAVEGRPPFDKGAPLPTLTAIVNEAPRPAERAGQLGPVIERLLVKDPAARLSEAQLQERLAAVANAPAPAARPGDTMVLELDEPLVVGPPVDEAPPAPPTPPTAPAYKPPPPPPPTAPAPQPAPAPALPGRGVNWTVPAVVGLLLLGLLAVTLATRGTDDPPADTAGGPTTTAAATAATTPSTAGGGGTSPTTAAPSAGNSRAPSTADWIPYTDPQTGFSISYPKGWSVRTDGTLTDFRDPETGAYLRVDHVQPPKPSPVGAWEDYEPTFAAEHAGYQRIRIEPTTYAGYEAAIWEFTYTSGGAELRVANLGFITGRYGFALYFQTRAGDWDRLQPVYQAFKDSFEAPA